MAHNFVPEPPLSTSPPEHIDLNKICYCNSELLQFEGQPDNDWTCNSCYKLIPNDYIPSYMCPLANHNRDFCLYAKICGHGANICRDCYHGINDLKEMDQKENNNNNKSVTYRKLNHTLDLIS